jgi:hypothetical protein
MLGMQTPEQAKQDKIEEIMGQYGEGTKSYEQLMQIADSFRSANMPDLWKEVMDMAKGMASSSVKISADEQKFDLVAEFVPCAIAAGGWRNASAECRNEVFAKHAEMERGDQLGNIHAKSDVDYISKDLAGVEESAVSGQKTVSDAKLAKDLLASGARTGFGAEWGVEAKKFSNFFLGTDMETASTETLNSVFKSMTLEALGAMSGAASDKDVDFVKDSGPTLGKTTASNLLLLDYRMFKGNRSKRLSKYLSKWNSEYIAANPDKRPTVYEYTAAKNKFRNSPENTFNFVERHNNLKTTASSVNTATSYRNMSKQHKLNQSDIKTFSDQLD